jgi:acyl carrier protein
MTEIPPDVLLYIERREQTLGVVRQLLATIINYTGDPADIDPDAGLFGTGLGLDSLDAMEVLVALDMDMGIKLEGDDPIRMGLRSVNGVVDVIMRARGELE